MPLQKIRNKFNRQIGVNENHKSEAIYTVYMYARQNLSTLILFFNLHTYEIDSGAKLE